LAEGEIAIFEEDAGYLVPEHCLEAYFRLAEIYGASLHFNEAFLRWENVNGLIHVETTLGKYVTRKLVLSVGAWAPKLYGDDLRCHHRIVPSAGTLSLPSPLPSADVLMMPPPAPPSDRVALASTTTTHSAEKDTLQESELAERLQRTALGNAASTSMISSSPGHDGLKKSFSLHIERRVLFWMKPQAETDDEDSAYILEKFKAYILSRLLLFIILSMLMFLLFCHAKEIPVYIWDFTEGNFYGFPTAPSMPEATKIAFHLLDETNPQRHWCDSPETLDRNVSPAEAYELQQTVKHRIPSIAAGTVMETATCMYTVTPDEHL
jgi:glycine/D-amino acid oxidase-like deaminating enzyme